ncbi:MAG: LarC family nickel insertion protein, partial [Candidatus Obscuribacterales bacterium]|nr:LarC family nickel insertion protein [Candidatus Obscuribacterales bacterium]
MSTGASTKKHAHFDCQFGAAGDMLLASLLDAGVDKEAWLQEIKKLALPQNSFKVNFKKVKRCSISASKLDVEVLEDYAEPHAHELQHSHRQEAHGRNLSEICEIIRKSEINPRAKDLSIAIFERLAKAESEIHDLKVDELHFHELGAIDAIVDIVGFAIAFVLAEIDSASCSALALGSGTVETAHGIFPVPAPAVIKILESSSLKTSAFEIPFECLTPTGAAILAEVCNTSQSLEIERITQSGFGAGTKDPEGWPNLL